MTRLRADDQPEAARLLEAALAEGPAHAYLFHGPRGVGKRELARAFAHELLGTTRTFHPDLYELDALGEMIRIDAIRELRRGLHMRPFEADRRVYLIFSAHLMNEDAADAEAAADPLVRDRRVDVAVADDPRAAVERGPDHPLDELGARGRPLADAGRTVEEVRVRGAVGKGGPQQPLRLRLLSDRLHPHAA